MATRGRPSSSSPVSQTQNEPSEPTVRSSGSTGSTPPVQVVVVALQPASNVEILTCEGLSSCPSMTAMPFCVATIPVTWSRAVGRAQPTSPGVAAEMLLGPLAPAPVLLVVGLVLGS